MLCFVAVYRFWKRIVKGAAPPTDLRSGSSLVQMSRGPGGQPSLSFVDASTIDKLPRHGGHAPVNGAGGVHAPVDSAFNGAGVHHAPGAARY